MRRSRAIIKKHAFLYVFHHFFHVQPKHQNGAIIVNIEDCRPCLGNSSYGAPQWALMVRLLQKERLKSPHKSLFYVTWPFGFLVIWVILPSHFRTRMGLPKKKCHLQFCLN